MRILVCTTAGSGHIGPTTPLAEALQRAGHEVHWATAAPACTALERRGFRVHAAGLSVPERIARFVAIAPPVPTLPPRARRAFGFSTNFAALAGPVMLDALLPIVDALAPELIVHEVCELAAPAIATARGIPRIVVAFSGAMPQPLLAAALEPAAALWGRFGLEVPPDLGLTSTTYLHPFAPSMGQRPAGGDVRDIGPAAAAAAEAPDWLASLGRERPLVYATFGTEYPPTAPWPALMEALGRLDVDALVTIGPGGDPATLIPATRAVRGSLRVERFVPQAVVLARAAAVISHGGAGTVIGAAARGIPQVVLPLMADQFDNADALREAGVALVLEPHEVEADRIAAAITAALAGQLSPAARALQAEFAAMPNADAVVGALGLG
jgi:UDP:flavonoid glycosyltransferase YjiC (YdhE family)